VLKKENLDSVPERAFYGCRKDANAFTTRRSRSTSPRLSVYSSFDYAPGKREKNYIAMEHTHTQEFHSAFMRCGHSRR